MHVPSVAPSWSHVGSPSTQVCVRDGNPSFTSPPGFLICHSAMHELRVLPPGSMRIPPGSATTLHWASQPLPGAPLSGPASHSSAHSTRLLPQPSLRQLALQPSHD